MVEERHLARGLYRYSELDESDELGRAVQRMEDRSREPTSLELFDELVRPLIRAFLVDALQVDAVQVDALQVGASRVDDTLENPASGPPETSAQTVAGASAWGKKVLEVGCGTAAMSRRAAAAYAGLSVFATDKSEGMIEAAKKYRAEEGLQNLSIAAWDVTDSTSFPFDQVGAFDLIFSSVMIPYLASSEASVAVRTLVDRLRPGGTLAFIEQDLSSDCLHFPDRELSARIFAKDERVVPSHAALGMRDLLQSADLSLLPRQSFLWTEERYGPYMRDLLARIAEDALSVGRIDQAEHESFLGGLELLANDGNFYYGLVYHRIAGMLP